MGVLKTFQLKYDKRVILLKTRKLNLTNSK